MDRIFRFISWLFKIVAAMCIAIPVWIIGGIIWLDFSARMYVKFGAVGAIGFLCTTLFLLFIMLLITIYRKDSEQREQ